MFFYENEKRIVKEIEDLFKSTSTRSGGISDPLKKKRELFHFYTFIDLENYKEERGEIVFDMPEDGLGADVEIIQPRKRAIEITECIDGPKEHRIFKESVNSLFEGNGYPYTSGNSVDGLRGFFAGALKEKSKKVERYKKDGFTVELLVVTDAVYENCPVTGTWVEKFLTDEFVGCIPNLFDKVYVLIYHASGRDGGPVVREYPEDVYSYQHGLKQYKY